jgi:hypothetical protein
MKKLNPFVRPPLMKNFMHKMETRESLKAWKGFGCMDYARFDFRLRDDKLYTPCCKSEQRYLFDASFAMAAEVLQLFHTAGWLTDSVDGGRKTPCLRGKDPYIL